MNIIHNQELAINKLSKLKAGALFMKMGTGKTKTAIELIKLKQNDIDIIFWIAPASLIHNDNYKNEINKWSDGLNKEIKYFTIEGISISDYIYFDFQNLAKQKHSFCIIDESITIKNTEAGRTKRLLKMWDLFKFRLILNGTPISKGLIDLYSQIQFIHPKILNMTEAQFANNYLVYFEDGNKPWKRWSKPANEQALIEIIKPYIFDSDLEIDCKLNNNYINISLNKYEIIEYRNFKEDFLSKNNQNDELDFFSVSQKFQHFYTMCNSKKENLIRIINEITNRKEKVIIFCKYLSEIEYISKLLNNTTIYTGERKDNLSYFLKGNSNILICTYGVGSFGHNWQEANNVIFLSQTFDFKDKTHALYRVYRTGQNKDVNVYDFYIKNVGLENLIEKSLNKKQNVLSNVCKLITKEEVKKL